MDAPTTQLEVVDRRLNPSVFIDCDADRLYYQQLVAEVQEMARPDDKLTIPDVHEMHAWRRLWAVRTALKRRAAASRPAPTDAPVHDDNSADWNRYVSEHAHIMGLLRDQKVSWTTLEYAGLSRDDLADPVPKEGPDARFGRRAGWTAIAQQISLTLGRLQSMSRQEFAAIPGIVATRRAAAEREVMALRIAALESALTQKEVREVYENGL